MPTWGGSSDQADVPEQQLASHREVRCIVELVPVALPAQPAFPRPQGRRRHGDRRHESSIRAPGT